MTHADAQSRPVPMDRDEEAFMRALGRVLNGLPRVLDADMTRESSLPLSDYTTLMFLSEAPTGRMRITDLATASNLTISGMTRLVNRLESQGYVERVKCPEDARGSNAVLTRKGLDRLHEAWPAHLASVRRHVLGRVGKADLVCITRALERIAPGA